MNDILQKHIRLKPGTILFHKTKKNKKKTITAGPFLNEKTGKIEYFAHDGKFDRLIEIDKYEVEENQEKN